MTFVEEQISRLTRGWRQCDEALDVPRRLGGDATGEELADDKRLARRIRFRIEVALEDWCDSFTPPAPDGSGNRLKWSEWWHDWCERAEDHANQAENSSQQHAIQRELESLGHVMSEHGVR